MERATPLGYSGNRRSICLFSGEDVQGAPQQYLSLSPSTAGVSEIWFISAAGVTLNLRFEPHDTNIIEGKTR